MINQSNIPSYNENPRHPDVIVDPIGHESKVLNDQLGKQLQDAGIEMSPLEFMGKIRKLRNMHLDVRLVVGSQTYLFRNNDTSEHIYGGAEGLIDQEDSEVLITDPVEFARARIKLQEALYKTQAIRWAAHETPETILALNATQHDLRYPVQFMNRYSKLLSLPETITISEWQEGPSLPSINAELKQRITIALAGYETPYRLDTAVIPKTEPNDETQLEEYETLSIRFGIGPDINNPEKDAMYIYAIQLPPVKGVTRGRANELLESNRISESYREQLQEALRTMDERHAHLRDLNRHFRLPNKDRQLRIVTGGMLIPLTAAAKMADDNDIETIYFPTHLPGRVSGKLISEYYKMVRESESDEHLGEEDLLEESAEVVFGMHERALRNTAYALVRLAHEVDGIDIWEYPEPGTSTNGSYMVLKINGNKRMSSENSVLNSILNPSAGETEKQT